MDRTKTVLRNAVWELGYYLIVIVLGFLAPRYIIMIYGSEVNGLSSTITQILNVILILQAGAATAAVFSLYKPIAENDVYEISKCISQAEKFFKKISFLFAGIVLIVAFVSSRFIQSGLESGSIFAAFLIMGLKSFLDLYFTSKFRIIFTAYQEKFVISIATLIEQVVYYALVFLTLYIRLHYLFLYIWFFAGCVAKVVYLDLKYKQKYEKIIPRYTGEDPGNIKGRRYSLANEVAHSVVSSSIAIILSFMYGLQEASVYSVYALVGQALSLMGTALYSAFAPSFGNLVAADNKENSGRVFRIFQFLFVMFNSVMYYSMVMLIVPFVEIYTSGAADIDYANPRLACLLALHGIVSAYRIPYNVIVSSCGYFKETWKQPVICAVVSLAVSCLLGMIDYSFILLGPILFYLANFLYQHFCIKRLATHLVSNRIFLMFGISIAGFIAAAAGSVVIPIQRDVFSWLLAGLFCLMGSALFVFAVTRILLPAENKAAAEYIMIHLRRQKQDA